MFFNMKKNKSIWKELMQLLKIIKTIIKIIIHFFPVNDIQTKAKLKLSN